VGDRGPSGRCIIVVTGLPRSGTSMMMAMLAAGGLEVVSDGLRAADHDNPRGYFEDERVKRLGEGADDWLDSACGKAVKIVSPLLERLPTRHCYQVIFMRRSIDEILASQHRMMQRSGLGAGDGDAEAAYQTHLRRLEAWLAGRRGMDTMYVGYHDIILAPEAGALRIARFLGRTLDQEAMVRAVDPSLYRERHEHP
jgi:hypothetical protein